MSNDVIVSAGTQILEVDPMSGSVAVVNAGPQGPPGSPSSTSTPSGPATGDLSGTYPAPSVANDSITNAKLANMVTARVKGRKTAGTGDPEDLTGTEVTALLDVFTSLLKGLVPASAGGTTNFLRADGAWAAPAGGGGSPSGAAGGELAGNYPNPTIADNVIDAANIMASAIITAKINNLAVTTAKIADANVTNGKLSNVGSATLKGRATAGSGSPEDLTGTQATALLDVFTSLLKGLVPPSGGGSTTFLRADGTWAVPPTSTGTVGKYVQDLNGTLTSETVAHNLNTRDVVVSVYKGTSPYTAVDVDWDATTVNSITVRYNPNLGAGYRIVVLG